MIGWLSYCNTTNVNMMSLFIKLSESFILINHRLPIHCIKVIMIICYNPLKYFCKLILGGVDQLSNVTLIWTNRHPNVILFKCNSLAWINQSQWEVCSYKNYHKEKKKQFWHWNYLFNLDAPLLQLAKILLVSLF